MNTKTSGRVTPKGTRSKGASGSPTTASQWKSKTAKGTLVTVPSGNTAILRAVGMEAFLTQGLIPNGLIPVIMEAMEKAPTADKPGEIDMMALLKDPDKLNQIVDLANAATVHCCIDPKVSPVPRDAETNELIPMGDDRRDEDKLYVDEVDFNDKMFIFNFAVGGTANLEKFREEQGTHVVALQSSEDVVKPTQRPG